jgi:hypothetical protein
MLPPIPILTAQALLLAVVYALNRRTFVRYAAALFQRL